MARDVLSSGGNAADAAVALAFTLGVTYPVAAGIGSEGTCLAWNAKNNTVESLSFNPSAPGTAMTPALARGLYALHARHGSLRWEGLLVPSENLARFGFPVSRALHARLAEMPPRSAGPSGSAYDALRMAREGDTVRFPDLASTLGSLRQQGPGVLHRGPIAREVLAGYSATGHRLSQESLQDVLPAWAPSEGTKLGNGRLHALFGNGSPAASAGTTTFSVADRSGNAVACILSLGAPFGTGDVVPGRGFLIGAGGSVPGQALLLVNQNSKEFRASASQADTGPAGALQSVVEALDEGTPPADAIRDAAPPTGASARVNVLSCPEGIPPNPASCRAQADPRGSGYALQSGL